MNLLIGILVLISVCFFSIRRAGGTWPREVAEGEAFVEFTDRDKYKNIAMVKVSHYEVPNWLQHKLYRINVQKYPEVFIRLDNETHMHFKVHRKPSVYDNYGPKLVEIHYGKGNYYSAQNFEDHQCPPMRYYWHNNRMPPDYHAFVAIPRHREIYFAPLLHYNETDREARTTEARAREAGGRKGKAGDMDVEMTSLTPAKRYSSFAGSSTSNTRQRQS